MGLTKTRRAGHALVGAVAIVATAVALSDQSWADSNEAPPPLPVFTAAPTAWSPNVQIWPYNTFTYRVTPEMVGGMSDSCQWFNAQFDTLMAQINEFDRDLGDQHDDYTVGGLQREANAVVANIDQSTAFLVPRVKPLIVTNNPDNFGPYSPIYGGEPITHLTFQLSRIIESIKKKDPSGVTHANVVAAAGRADALRNTGACN